MTRLAILSALLLLVACENEPIQRERTNNPNVSVALLFTHEGCSVFRFEDGGRNHYYATCATTVQSTHTETCGKNCTRTITEETTTAIAPETKR